MLIPKEGTLEIARRHDQLTNCTDKDIERPTLNVGRTTKVDEFDDAFTIQDYVLVLDVSVNYSCFGVQVVQRPGNLDEDAPAFVFFHVCSQLDVIEQVHTRQTMRRHLDIVVDIILKEVLHLHNIRMLVTISP